MRIILAWPCRNPNLGREPGYPSVSLQERPCQPGAADGRPRTGATGCPMTGSGSELRSEPEQAADAKPNAMRTDATASARTVITSFPATTTAWTTYNGFQPLAIKRRPQGKPQRAMHGIVNQGFIPSKKNPGSIQPGVGGTSPGAAG